MWFLRNARQEAGGGFRGRTVYFATGMDGRPGFPERLSFIQ